MDDVFEGLNPAQAEAVRCTQGPSLIIAGAGAGKTRTLTRRVAHLINEGVPSANILILTFTNKAADELKERLVEGIGYDAQVLCAGTFHSVTVNYILRHPMFIESAYLDSVGIDPFQMSILDEQDADRILKESVDSLPEDIAEEWTSSGWSWRQLQEIMGVERAFGRNVDDFMAKAADGKDPVRDGVYAQVWREYDRRCREAGCIDFDDILLHAANMLEAEPQKASVLAEDFKYILCDEYQDTNPVQMKIVDAIAQHHENIFCVGDEKQSIYKFRGSDINVMLHFRKRYPTAAIIEMNSNYRSQAGIIRAANQCAGRMGQKLSSGQLQTMVPGAARTPALVEVATDVDEAKAVAQAISRDIRDGKPGGQIAALYRYKSMRHHLERELSWAGINHKVVGATAFHERMEVKDVVAMLSFLMRDWDSMATRRLLRSTSLGVSEQACKKAMSEKRIPAAKFLKDKAAERNAQGQPTKAAGRMQLLLEYRQLVQEMVALDAKAHDIAKAAADFWDLALRPRLARKASGPIGQAKFKAQTENVQMVIGQFQSDMEDGMSAEDSLSRLQLMVEPKDGEDVDNQVQVMTIHAAKGLEFDNVYILGADDSSQWKIEGPDDDEEERRIFYVAMTRAREKLAILHPLERTVNGKTVTCGLSRYAKEIKAGGAVREVRFRPAAQRRPEAAADAGHSADAEVEAAPGP